MLGLYPLGGAPLGGITVALVVVSPSTRTVRLVDKGSRRVSVVDTPKKRV